MNISKMLDEAIAKKRKYVLRNYAFYFGIMMNNSMRRMLIDEEKYITKIEIGFNLIKCYKKFPIIVNNKLKDYEFKFLKVPNL